MISLAAKTASIKEPKRSSALVRQETIASYLFLLPSLIFFLGFVIYPMILCVVTSFFDSTMNRADVFVGLANYAELFADPIFIGALRNTFIIVVVSVPVTCAFSLWVSSAIVDLPEWATCNLTLPIYPANQLVMLYTTSSGIYQCCNNTSECGQGLFAATTLSSPAKSLITAMSVYPFCLNMSLTSNA